MGLSGKDDVERGVRNSAPKAANAALGLLGAIGTPSSDPKEVFALLLFWGAVALIIWLGKFLISVFGAVFAWFWLIAPVKSFITGYFIFLTLPFWPFMLIWKVLGELTRYPNINLILRLAGELVYICLLVFAAKWSRKRLKVGFALFLYPVPLLLSVVAIVSVLVWDFCSEIHLAVGIAGVLFFLSGVAGWIKQKKSWAPKFTKIFYRIMAFPALAGVAASLLIIIWVLVKLLVMQVGGWLLAT